MRIIPIDAGRIQLIASGKVSPKSEFVQLSDGSSRASGNQAKDPETGLALWVLDCIVDDDSAKRAEVVGVTLASSVEPTVRKWQLVIFENLVASIYTDSGSGRPALSFKATGISTHGVKAAPAPNSAA